MRFIDLVAVKHTDDSKPFLFQAPAFCSLSPNQVVEIDTKLGKTTGKVVATYTVDPESDEYRFILAAMGAKEPLRNVLGVYEYRHIAWPLENKEDNLPLY